MIFLVKIGCYYFILGLSLVVRGHIICLKNNEMVWRFFLNDFKLIFIAMERKFIGCIKFQFISFVAEFL